MVVRRRMMLSDDNPHLGYVSNGLVCLLDGIVNTRTGIRNEDATSWEDLSGNENDLVFVHGSTTIMNFKVGDYFCWSQNNYAHIIDGAILPTIKQAEIVCRLRAAGAYLLSFNSNKTGFWLGSYALLGDQKRKQSITDIENFHSYSLVYEDDICYEDNQEVSASGSSGFSDASNFNVGKFRGEICCIRLYDRVLSDAERLKNYNNDVKRFNL